MNSGSAAESALLDLLEVAQRRGLVGPAPLASHLDNARGFAEVIGPSAVGRNADIGTGAGLPGLLLALSAPGSEWVLVDSHHRAAEFVESAVVRLGLTARVRVECARVEELGRSLDHRGTFDRVVARAFGPPAAVAEGAAPLLRPGGALIVSEPPEPEPNRWPENGLAALGMRPVRAVVAGKGGRFQVVHQESPCPQRYPRRPGMAVKRRLF